MYFEKKPVKNNQKIHFHETYQLQLSYIIYDAHSFKK